MKKTFKINIYVPNSKDPLFSDPIQKEIVAELEDKSFLVGGKKVWRVSHPSNLICESKWYDEMFLSAFGDVHDSLKFKESELTSFFEELLRDGEVWVGDVEMGRSSQEIYKNYYKIW